MPENLNKQFDLLSEIITNASDKLNITITEFNKVINLIKEQLKTINQLINHSETSQNKTRLKYIKLYNKVNEIEQNMYKKKSIKYRNKYYKLL